MDKMPVLFVGHGSPMNAIEHNAFTETLSELECATAAPESGMRCVGSLDDVRSTRADVSPIQEPFTTSTGFRSRCLTCSIRLRVRPSRRRKSRAIQRLKRTNHGDSIMGRGACCGTCIPRRIFLRFN